VVLVIFTGSRYIDIIKLLLQFFPIYKHKKETTNMVKTGQTKNPAKNASDILYTKDFLYIEQPFPTKAD